MGRRKKPNGGIPESKRSPHPETKNHLNKRHSTNQSGTKSRKEDLDGSQHLYARKVVFNRVKMELPLKRFFAHPFTPIHHSRAWVLEEIL